MLKKIDHIAVVVKDIDQAARAYADMFGFKAGGKREGPGFISMFAALGDIKMEFFQPLNMDNTFGKFLEKTGGGLHHISFVTDDVEKEMKKLKAQGRKLQDETPRQMPDAKIVFIHPSAAENVLIELIERK